MDGLVAGVLEEARLVENRLAHDRAEPRVMDQGAQIVLVGQLQPPVELVEPGDRLFEGAAGVEGGGARVASGEGFGARGGLVDVRPFRLQKAELRHGGQSSPLKARCWRAD